MNDARVERLAIACAASRILGTPRAVSLGMTDLPTRRRRAARAERAADVTPATARLVADPATAARLARPVMRLADQETFVALYLTVRNTLLGDPHVVAIGTLTSVEVHPREVFREAIRRGAAGLLVLHNHPSGDPAPSAEDVELTRRLRACGDLLGIPVVDHVVVTAGGHTSIHEWTGRTS